jgi:hypothetical protein
VLDHGDYSGDQIKTCAQAKITTYLPKPQTSNQRTKAYFAKRDPICILEDDEYECPTGKRLLNHMSTAHDWLKIYRYWTLVCAPCAPCALKQKFTPDKQRRVSR